LFGKEEADNHHSKMGTITSWFFSRSGSGLSDNAVQQGGIQVFVKAFKLVSSILLTVTGLTWVFACAGPSPAVQAPLATTEMKADKQSVPTEAAAVEQTPSSKTLSLAWAATDPPSLDPHVCNDAGCLTTVRNVYEALVGYRYGATEIEGVLAEEWEVSDGGLSWTFKLRDGVSFADGSPVTPEDIVYSFDRLSAIGKGPAFVLSNAYAGAEVVNDRSATVKLERPIGPFLYMLPRVFIVNSDLVEEHATSDDLWAEKWLYDHGAGSGPFVLEDWEHGVALSIVKNAGYWNPDWPKVNRFVVRQIPERSTDRLLLEAGEIDLLYNPLIEHLPAYEANPDITVSEHDSLIGYQFLMSMVVPPLNDVRVRKAVALAFDYQAMIDGVYAGHAVQQQGPLPRRMNFHDDTLPLLQKDLEQAKDLLAEAGYPDGGFDLELLVLQGQPYQMGAAQILQEGLAELGVKLKIVEMTWATIVGRMQDQDNPGQMFSYYTFPAYPDPDAVLWSMFHTSQQGVGYNAILYGDAETDALLEKGRFSSDQAEREAAYKTLQRRIFGDYPAVWLVNPTWISVRRSWVKNYEYDPTWNQTFFPSRYIVEGKP
jgi:peptide/nickel transport system substrate-binding protein